MTEEDLRKLLEQHREEFGEFHVDWHKHRREATEVAKKVDEIRGSLIQLTPNLAHLSQLPLISSHLASIDRGNMATMNALIAQQGAAGRSNSKLVERMILICLAVVVILGIALMLVFVRESDKDFSLSKDGLSISRQSDNKKTQENAP